MIHDAIEGIRRQAGARSAWLLPATAGLLGIEQPIRCGDAEDGPSLRAIFSEAMPIPGRSGGELAQRLAALCGERRRAGSRRMLLRLALPDAGGAHLLLERGDPPASPAALALGLDALAATLRPPPHSAETAEAIAFLSRDGRLAALVDRQGIPLALTPLLRQALGGDRSGRPFILPEKRQAFLYQLRRHVPLATSGLLDAEGFDLTGSLQLLPLIEGNFVLAILQGELCQAAMLRALADGEVTPREVTCGLRLAEGKSYRTIASELGVSPDTVKLHLRALYQKLGVDGRDGLVARLGGLAPPPPLVRAMARRTPGAIA